MALTPKDILCCPPPLFHCFGLVCGFLSAITNGSAIVFPNDQFDPLLTVDALYNEKCTALLGVPTMMIAALSANRERKHKITAVRTGLAGGSAVPVSVMKQLDQDFGCQRMCIIYGMTETSPVTFMTTVNDPQEKREKTVGAIMPHTRAKVVDREGKIVPRGTPGEICTSGYALQLGYYKNEAKTAEAMKTDENGIRWMYTGDQGLIDEDGYCVITGRIKDMIIRGKSKLNFPKVEGQTYLTCQPTGGENIYPAEIEERMIEHPAIVEASVVGIKDEHYGEAVGAFLKVRNPNDSRPDLEEIRAFIKETKGSHKAPQHVFWIGDPGVGDDFPKTGSGKHQKHILRAISEKLLTASQPKAKL